MATSMLTRHNQTWLSACFAQHFVVFLFLFGSKIFHQDLDWIFFFLETFFFGAAETESRSWLVSCWNVWMPSCGCPACLNKLISLYFHWNPGKTHGNIPKGSLDEEADSWKTASFFCFFSYFFVGWTPRLNWSKSKGSNVLRSWWISRSPDFANTRGTGNRQGELCGNRIGLFSDIWNINSIQPMPDAKKTGTKEWGWHFNLGALMMCFLAF